MSVRQAHEALLVGGAGEIRFARTPAEAERELARGFRPSVVLLDLRAGQARLEAFESRLASHPACSAVPILGVRGDGDRLRLTLMNHLETLSSPARMEELIRLLEDVCLPLLAGGFPRVPEPDRAWRNRPSSWWLEGAETAS